MDSFAPGSKYSHNFKHQSSANSVSQTNFEISGPGASYGPPPNGHYGPPPPSKVNYRPPPPPPSSNYGPPPPPNGNYGPPPPSGKYGAPLQPPPTANYGPPQHSGGRGGTAFSQHQAHSSLGIQYGKQSGNLGPFPPHNGAQPSRPVAYRPPVPPGLFQTIGATVQHLDKFGVKPQLQAPTYIPPAANELPHTGPGNLNLDYSAPQHQQGVPQHITEQQLPQPEPQQIFVHQEQQQQQNGNAHAEYGVPPLPPALQQGPPPQPQYLSPRNPTPVQQHYTGPQHFNGGASYTAGATASYDNTAFAASQFNHETVQIQALPLQQETQRFHDCGNGPNLVGGGNFNYQQQQQQVQQHYSSGTGSSSIAQSIPVAEQHSQFVSGPASSYGPPPSGGNELDHLGYASEKSQVTTLPDGTNPEGLPGLDGLNMLSAQKSQAIHFSSQENRNDNTYQIHFSPGESQPTANHEEILSADLLQTILNAVEQPQPQHQPLPNNHKAESRSDIDINEEATKQDHHNEPNVLVQGSRNVEVEIQPEDENSVETDADVHEIKPIVVKEENEAKH